MAWTHPQTIGCRFSYLHLPSARCGHSMCAFNNKLILFGGFDGSKWLNDLQVLDRFALVWRAPSVQGAVPESRQYHASAVISSSMYVFGGYSGSKWLDDLWKLDLNSHVWQSLSLTGQVPSPREGHSMVASGAFLYILGGWDGSALPDFYYIDTQTCESFVLRIEIPAICGHSMTMVRGKMIVFGGFDGENWLNQLYSIQVFGNSVAVQKPKTIGIPGPRGYHSAQLVNKYLLFYAGFNGQQVMNDLLAFDTESFMWSIPDPGHGYFPAARNAHSMTLWGSELFIFGGYNGSRDTNELHVLETSAFSSLHDDLAIAFKKGLFQDLTVESSKGSCKVHTIIVKHRCPRLYFELIKQGSNNLEHKTVNVGDFSQEVLSVFCEFLYTDLCSPLANKETRDGVFLLAMKYNMNRLASLLFFKEQPPTSKLVECLNKAKGDTSLADFNVKIGEKLFGLHKVVISARCSYFSLLLSSGMRENTAKSVNLDNIDASAFEIIVDWMYSDKFFLINDVPVHTAIALLKAVNFLGIDKLVRMTELILEKYICLETVTSLFECSFLINAVRLRSSCVNFILRNYEKSSIKYDLVNLSKDCRDFLTQYLPKRARRHKTYENLSIFCGIKLDKENSPTNYKIAKKKLSTRRDTLKPNFVLKGVTHNYQKRRLYKRTLSQYDDN